MNRTVHFFYSFLFIFLSQQWAYADEARVHGATRVRPDALPASLEGGRAAIKQMEDTFLGVLKENPNDTAEEKLQRPKTLKELTDFSVKELLAGLDDGTLLSKMKALLSGNESFTDVERERVFGKLLEQVSWEDALALSKEYTLSRQALRKKLLDAVALQISRNPDLRASALAKAVAQAGKGNLEAYKEAGTKLEEDYGDTGRTPEEYAALKLKRKDSPPRPICFTCGEPVSNKGSRLRKPGEPDEPIYEFFDAMTTAAETALIDNGLDNKEGSGPFFNGSFGRTSEGKIVQVQMTADGEMTARTATDTTDKERKTLGHDPGLVKAVRKNL